jgi:CubicO group peptidase (beta-lactamase class C family)
MGESWEALLKQRVLVPLKMSSCRTGWPIVSDKSAPHGHRGKDGKFELHDLADGYELHPVIVPAGDVACNMADLAAFGRAHLAGLTSGHPLLKKETWQALHDAEVDHYALGWNVQDFADTHLGNTGTFFTSLVVSPQRRLVIALSLNGADRSRNDDYAGTVVGAGLRAFGHREKKPEASD